MKRTLSPNETIAVYLDAGIIPYLTGLRTIDFGRLNDEYLARRGVSDEMIADYFFERLPAALIMTSRDWHEVSYLSGAEAIGNDPRFAARYALARKYRAAGTPIRQSYFQFVFLRRDIGGPEPREEIAGG